MLVVNDYLRVTIIWRCIFFLMILVEEYYASTNIGDLHVEMVQGRQIVMFKNTCR